MREVNILGTFFAFDWPSCILLAGINIATKASCNKKCITNERNKAVEKIEQPTQTYNYFLGVKYSVSSIFLYYICIMYPFVLIPFLFHLFLLSLLAIIFPFFPHSALHILGRTFCHGFW